MKTTTLESLRLPELQARYAEVVGETTRSPNKTYLIKRIREALAAEEAKQAKVAKKAQTTTKAAKRAATKKTKPGAVQPAAEPEEMETADELAPAREPTIAQDVASAPAAEPGSMAMPASAEKPSPATEPTSANDSATADEIETLATENELAELLAEEEQMMDPDDTATASEGAAETKLSKLTVAELQQRYLEVVGRPTGSSHRRYLIWKIREAEKGRIPVGPRNRRDPGEPAPEFMILPVRMEEELVRRLDEARERLGLKNRMDLFRRALAAYLANAGETALAAALTPTA